MNDVTPMPDNDLIPIADYAKLQGVSPATVRQKILRGCLPEAFKLGNQWVIPKNTPYTDQRIRSGLYIGIRERRSRNK